MMKKLFTLISLLSFPFLGFSQTPEIGHFEQLKTVRRGDTLDVAWYYKPAAGTDVRSFQVDWQYKKRLFTHLSTTVDAAVSGNGPKFLIKIGKTISINLIQAEVIVMCPTRLGQ